MTVRSPDEVAGRGGAMTKGKMARAYLAGFATVKSVLELDGLTVQEIVEALEPDGEDPFLTPWKRGYNAAVRAAFGH
jgi:hypothetical protein